MPERVFGESARIFDRLGGYMKKIAITIMMFLILLGMTGCSVDGVLKESVETTQFQMLLNKGSCFVYTFRDSETGVWYMCTSEGITPRVNPDGSLYVSE